MLNIFNRKARFLEEENAKLKSQVEKLIKQANEIKAQRDRVIAACEADVKEKISDIKRLINNWQTATTPSSNRRQSLRNTSPIVVKMGDSHRNQKAMKKFDKTITKTFAKNLRLLRKRRKLSFRELAELVPLREHSLWRLEHGSMPQMLSAAILADFYGVTIDELMFKELEEL